MLLQKRFSMYDETAKAACCVGHTLSWGGGDASLLTACYDEHGPTGIPGPLDPTRKHTYAVVGMHCRAVDWKSHKPTTEDCNSFGPLISIVSAACQTA